MAEPRGHSGTAGGVFGLLVFLVGVAILGSTFLLARELFTRDPNELLGIQPGQELNLNSAGATLITVVAKVLLLLVMAIIGGMISSRGIRMYSDSRGVKPTPKVDPE